jgi:nucleoside-diphosphate-sugar epimerase
MARVLVTGANGFVGSLLCPLLAGRGYEVRTATRTAAALPPAVRHSVVVGDIGAQTQWAQALEDVDAVVHLAARAHHQGDGPQDARRYAETNAYGTQRLAQEAAHRGVRRFIYLSSVKVNGEESGTHAFGADDAPRPEDDYGRSKWQGEKLLAAAAQDSGMSYAMVRSPLVYGPGVRANFLRLLQWVDRQRPLPLAAIRNQRSLVSAWNLCDLLARLLEHPGAAGGTWMVSDGHDVSTPELVRGMGRLMGRRVRLLPVPPTLLRFVGTVVGRGPQARRLCGSLVVDVSRTRDRLQWTAPLSFDEGLARTVSWYLSRTHAPRA